MNGGSHTAYNDDVGQQNKDNQGGGFTMAGILFWIQEEWNKIEMQKIQWDLEKAEYQAQIASLLGERRGQENIKLDLIRRIKMLEYALREERKITEQLKVRLQKKERGESGTDGNENSVNSSSPDAVDGSPETDNKEKTVVDIHQRVQKDVESSQRASTQWKESIQRLKQYLREIGYNENILDLRHLRLRHFMDSNATDPQQEGGDEVDMGHLDRLPGHNRLVSTMHESEEAVLSTFDFLKDEPLNESSGEGQRNKKGKDTFDSLLNAGSKKFTRGASKKGSYKDIMASLQAADESSNSVGRPEEDAPFGQLNTDYLGGGFLGKATNDAIALGDLANVNIANEAEGNNNADLMPMLSFDASKKTDGTGLNEDDVFIGLNDGKFSKASPSPSMSQERRQWHLRHTLRGHWDCVRTVSFHCQAEPQLLSGGDDGCVILWNTDPAANPSRLSLDDTTSTATDNANFLDSSNGKALVDLSPVNILRGHEGPVLSSAIVPCEGGAVACTGGLDGSFRLWSVPPSAWLPTYLRDTGDDESNTTINTADVEETHSVTAFNVTTSKDHSDAVWCIAHDNNSNQPLLVTSSADSTVKLWNISVSNQYADDQQFDSHFNYSLLCRQTFHLEKQWNLASHDVATSISLFSNGNRMLVGTKLGQLLIVNVETGQLMFHETASTEENNRVYCVAAHNTMPLALAGLENGLLCYIDTQSEILVHSTVAHQQSVTSIAYEPQGLYFATASSDESLRLWDVSSRSCVQEMHAHRTKHQESALAVSFHSCLPFMASAGADSIVNLFSAVSIPRN